MELFMHLNSKTFQNLNFHKAFILSKTAKKTHNFFALPNPLQFSRRNSVNIFDM